MCVLPKFGFAASPSSSLPPLKVRENITLVQKPVSKVLKNESHSMAGQWKRRPLAEGRDKAARKRSVDVARMEFSFH